MAALAVRPPIRSQRVARAPRTTRPPTPRQARFVAVRVVAITLTPWTPDGQRDTIGTRPLSPCLLGPLIKRSGYVAFAATRPGPVPQVDPPADMATQAGEPRLAVAEAARAPSQIEQRWALMTVTHAAALVVRQQCPDEGVG